MIKRIFKKIKEIFFRIFCHQSVYYFIYEVDDNYKPVNLVTILSKKKQFTTFVVNSYCIKNEHFKQWCENHNRKEEDPNSMADYYNLNNPMVPYYVGAVRLKKDDIAGYLRISHGLIPVGTPYEKNFEYDFFINLLKISLDDEEKE